MAGIGLGCSLLGAFGGAAIYSNTVEGKTRTVYTEQTDGGVFKQAKMTPAVFSSSADTPDFVEAAERSINGVVNIKSEVTSNNRIQGPRYFDPFEFFFGIPGQPDQGRYREAPTRVAFGSGVIISTDGYIITNNHVIEGSSKVTVTTNDNREYDATIIGQDPATDIALLKIDATDLQHLPFGDSEKVRVGEWVLAIGNPFNLESTVTAGIVSAKGRHTMGQGNLQVTSFIQHDAAVNPGNSGGALVNTKGELIGINTMIYSQTGSYAGYSFAVPSSIAKKVVSDIKQYGVVQRAVLGVMGGNINSDLTKEYKLKVTEGAFVAGFSDSSAAKEAGIKEGDVITNLNGAVIRNMAQLQEQVSKYNPGDKVSITVDRNGKQLQMNVVLKNSQGTTEMVEQATPNSIGASFKSIDNKTAEKLGIRGGVIVTDIERNGAFAAAGIRRGFIILEINNRTMSTPEDVETISQFVIKNSNDKVLFVKGMLPNGRIRYVAIEL